MSDPVSTVPMSRTRGSLSFAVVGVAAGITTTAALLVVGRVLELLPEQLSAGDWSDYVGFYIGVFEINVRVGQFIVGLAFGLVLGGLLRRCGALTRVGLAAYPLFAAIGYLVAENVAIRLLDPGIPKAVIGALAGLSGALVLGLLSLPLVPALRQARFVAVTTVVGAAAGPLLDPYMRIAEGDGVWGAIAAFLILYCGWQGAYAASVGFVLAPLLIEPSRAGGRTMAARLRAMLGVPRPEHP